MASKPARRTDPEMAALMEARADGAREKQGEIDSLMAKLDSAPWIFEMAGKVKTLSFNESQARFFKLVLLKQVKDSKEYREKFGMTWEQFCEYARVDRRSTDEKLADLKPFNAEFLASFSAFSGFDFSKIRYLGRGVSESLLQLDGNRLLFDGEAIPFEPEAVQALIEQIQDALQKEREERVAEKKTHDRRMADEKKYSQKLEKQLTRYERNAHDKGVSPEEDALIQQMETLRISFDGFMLQTDPARIEEDGGEMTPRMTAIYVSTLQYIRTQINAAYSTAVETFGDPETFPEEAWTPGKK